MNPIETQSNFKITNINPALIKPVYSEYRNKKLFKSHAAAMILKHVPDHDIFFVSITFKDVLNAPPKRLYRDALEAIDQKITQAALNRPSAADDRLKPQMILIPEISEKSPYHNMMTPNHYHGFLLIQKPIAKKFHEKCLIDYHLIKDVDPEDETDRTHHYFISSFVIDQPRFELHPDTFHLEQLFADDDIQSRMNYSTKNFMKSRGSKNPFTSDDIQFISSKSGNAHEKQ